LARKIILSGSTRLTGKPTIKNKLKNMGCKIYEEYEVFELELNALIKNPIPELQKEVKYGK
jgi:hypothetical protein